MEEMDGLVALQKIGDCFAKARLVAVINCGNGLDADAWKEALELDGFAVVEVGDGVYEGWATK